MTAGANRRKDDLVGVPRAGDLVGRGAVEIGEYAVARMGPTEFERFIASVRSADSAQPSPRRAPAGWGRRMSDQPRHAEPAPTGPPA